MRKKNGSIHMFNLYTVSFFGHRDIADYILALHKVEHLVGQLLNAHTHVEFLVGRNGDFDEIATAAVRSVRHHMGEERASLVLVLPYLTAAYKENADAFATYYDSTEMNAPPHCHYKAAYGIRNRQMIGRSDLCVFYVDHAHGGAYQTLLYAQKCGKPVLNLADTVLESR